MKKTILMLWILMLLPVNSWSTTILSFGNYDPTNFSVGDTFTIDLMADIGDSVLGYDLDLDFDSSLLTFNSYTYDSTFFSGDFLLDTQELYGLSFPNKITGNIKLASFVFTIKALDFNISVSANDVGDGFILAEQQGFAELDLSGARIPANTNTPAPEPASMLLLGFGLLGLAGVSRKKLVN